MKTCSATRVTTYSCTSLEKHRSNSVFLLFFSKKNLTSKRVWTYLDTRFVKICLKHPRCYNMLQCVIVLKKVLDVLNGVLWALSVIAKKTNKNTSTYVWRVHVMPYIEDIHRTQVVKQKMHIDVKLLTHAFWYINTLRPRQNGRHFITFINAFSWMKTCDCRWKFQWSLLLWVELKIFQHWIR